MQLLRLLVISVLIGLATFFGQQALANQETPAFVAVAAAIVAAAVGLTVNFFTRQDTEADRSRSRSELITLLSAEMHNFSRHHASNLNRLTQALVRSTSMREIIEMMERFSFQSRPGSDEGELFKVTSVDQLSHLPRYLSRDFMRVHIIARNLEADIKRSLASIKGSKEYDVGFREFVTDELYRLGLRIERATVQGERLLDRLEGYENRNWFVRSWKQNAQRLMQRPGLRTFIDRPMQPDGTKAYEELNRWREIVRKRNSFSESFVFQIYRDIFSEKKEPKIIGQLSGTFNQIFKINSGRKHYSIRVRVAEDLFRYDYRILKEVLVSNLQRQGSNRGFVDEISVAFAVRQAKVDQADCAIRGLQEGWLGPAVYGHGIKDDRPFIVTEWLDGNTGQAFANAPNYRKLGRAIASLHRIHFAKAYESLEKSGAELSEYLDAVSKEIMDRNLSSGQIVERDQLDSWVSRRLASSKERFRQTNSVFTICHNDLHPFNLFEMNGTIKAIDWDNAVIAHPFVDFVKCKYWSAVSGGYLGISFDHFNEFCAGYQIEAGERDVSANFAFREVEADPLFQLHEMRWLFRIWSFETARHASGNDHPGPFPGPAHYEPLIWNLAK